MYTIDQEYRFEQVINKSTFICYLFPIQSVEEAMEKIALIRKQHYDATHNCYAMITGLDILSARSSDDGEPSKTAGIPIYEVLSKNNLTNVLAIVTRYFGGIKLGAGGLIRAYSGSVSKALQTVKLIKIEKKIKVRFTFNYNYINEMNKLLDEQTEITKDFGTNVIYTYEILDENHQELFDTITSTTNASVLIEVLD